MMTTIKPKSRILKEVHEMASDLHEIGDKKPSGPSLKLLSLIERKGLEAVL